MSNFEARINTKFGQLVIHFDDQNDLAAKMQEAKVMVQAIESKSADFAIVKEVSVTGLEGICTITPEGLPHIIVYPESDSDKVRLALFASQRPLSTEEITNVTGVKNATALRFMKFDEVIRTDDKFSLSGKGRTIVATKLLPTLRPIRESQASA